MEVTVVAPSSKNMMDRKWSKMVLLSIAFHLGLFSVILFVPGQIPTRMIKGAVYEVDLVEMPRTRRLKARENNRPKAANNLDKKKKAVPAKRISRPKKKEKAVVIAKRTVKTKSRKAEKPKVSPTKLIDQAVTRVEKKVKDSRKDHIEQAITKLETRVKGEAAENLRRSGEDSGITIRMYLIEVEEWIKGNWAYPVALAALDSKKNLEAIVVMRVRSNGAILKSWFKRRSSNVIFDQSVQKAVDRSDPIPPFPEGYRKSYDEIEITFNLRELEGY